MLQHKHLILKGWIDRPSDAATIARSLYDIVDLVAMKVLSPPNVVRCEEPGNHGYTGVVLLTTSHMVWHDWDADNGVSDLQFDLYSCACFEPRDVLRFLRDRHGLHAGDYKLFDRMYAIEQEESY
jgi:S-adenosylmethionine/arginine decarboxylase-like enzyme